MISFTSGQSLFQTLSQNSTTANATLYGQLANIEHRYLLQKFFANEGSYKIQTIGQTDLTLASAVAIGATSATLDFAWPYQTTQAQLTFSDGEVVLGSFTNGSTTVSWTPALIGTSFSTTADLSLGATTATLSTAWAYPTGSYLTSFSDGSTKTVTFTLNSTSISWAGGLSSNVSSTIYTSTIATASNASIGGVQFYPFPPNYSKLKDLTITVGVLQWTLTEVRTREEWDNLNVFPYYASIPSKFFIYPGGDKGGQIGIWPIPSTTGNTITYNYKFRVPDLSIADYTTPGTVSVTRGSTAVTGSGTSWTATTNPQLESRWIQFVPTSSSSTSGDNLWYQIASVNSATSITLYQPYQGTTITATTAGNYTVGQMPIIAEDFQDMLVWKALQYYYTSIVDNAKKATEYLNIYNTKLAMLKEYSGTNTVNVNLSPKKRRGNPNLYGQTFGP